MSAYSPMDPVQALLGQTSLQNNLFPANSRYFGQDTLTLQPQTGPPIIYLTRRFLPPAANFQVIQTHTVLQGERLDNIAAQYLGDPTLFWRLCDANNTMRPADLTATVGATIEITLPQGITGSAL